MSTTGIIRTGIGGLVGIKILDISMKIIDRQGKIGLLYDKGKKGKKKKFY